MSFRNDQGRKRAYKIIKWILKNIFIEWRFCNFERLWRKKWVFYFYIFFRVRIGFGEVEGKILPAHDESLYY